MAKLVLNDPGVASSAEHRSQPPMEVYQISPAEALEMITLLAAQLACVAPAGRMGGACPEINVSDRGQVVKRIMLMVK